MCYSLVSDARRTPQDVRGSSLWHQLTTCKLLSTITEWSILVVSGVLETPLQLVFPEFLIMIPSCYTSRGPSKIQSPGKWLKRLYQMKTKVWQSVFNLKLWLDSTCSLLYQQMLFEESSILLPTLGQYLSLNHLIP